ncbi:MAG: DHH family phosphoesterase [Gemmatimonadota bacterium]|nr:DHH family phosphoesterase [Gemmatimonadota bacterium]
MTPHPVGWTDRLASLLDAVDGADRLFVLTHDNPDPDALASAAAMAVLLDRTTGKTPRVAFGGIVGRAENRAVIHELEIDFERLEDIEVTPGSTITLVDTQPRAGNNSLPEGRIVSAVVDHHPVRSDTAVQFTDVRPGLGACATMMVQYLRAADLEPDAWLATALFYAIQAETMDLSREATPEDVEASTYLYALGDPAAISRIRHPRVPVSYFRSLHTALAAATRHERVVAVPMISLPYPDLVAEIADLLLQMHGVDWAVAIGRFRDRLLVSVRARQSGAHAGSLVRTAFGDRGSAGGHGTFAGGQIDVRGKSDEEVVELAAEVMQDLLIGLEVDADTGDLLVTPPRPDGETT